MSQRGDFAAVLERHPFAAVAERIRACTAREVERALGRNERTLDDFAALVSPAAEPYVEHLARASVARTRQRFGNVLSLYIPLYLSNECSNTCTYCGFSHENKVERLTLDGALLDAEADHIRRWGFEHLLLLTGEANHIGADYMAWALDRLRGRFAQLSLEVQPLETAEYAKLMEHSLYGVFLYQESYHRERWRIHHPKGRKSLFDWRLAGPERLGEAGVHRIGIGALIGLEDWRAEAWSAKLHLDWLKNRYWRSRYSLSFPRMRPFHGGIREVDMSDRQLVQLVCAHRLCDGDVDLALSTRERPALRDRLFPLGFTAASAGSRTDPGGYTRPRQALEQFEISDDRDPHIVADAIRACGLEPIWKDWDPALAGLRRA
jgi:2-iminoacetate synthase